MNMGKFIIHIAVPNQNREDEQSYVTVRFYKNNGNTGEILLPENRFSTRSQKLSPMNNIYFGAIFYYICLDMKLDFIISSNFFKESH